MREIFLTFFYVGKAPFAPGSFGSFAGLVVAYLILLYFPLETLFLLSILTAILGVKAIDVYEANGGVHDDKSIVIDEVVGIWIAISLAFGITEIDPSYSWIIWICSFIFFRVFDIWKPSIIGRIDRNVRGGLGVMGDDVVASIFAAISSAIAYGVVLKFL